MGTNRFSACRGSEKSSAGGGRSRRIPRPCPACNTSHPRRPPCRSLGGKWFCLASACKGILEEYPTLCPTVSKSCQTLRWTKFVRTTLKPWLIPSPVCIHRGIESFQDFSGGATWISSIPTVLPQVFPSKEPEWVFARLPSLRLTAWDFDNRQCPKGIGTQPKMCATDRLKLLNHMSPLSI